MNYSWALYLTANCALGVALEYAGIDEELSFRHFILASSTIRRWMGVVHDEDFTEDDYDRLNTLEG